MSDARRRSDIPRDNQRWRSPPAHSSRYLPPQSRERSQPRSPRRWRSPSRCRDRSRSPPPKGYLSPRRSRSRSPHYSVRGEEVSLRRSRLLAEKVMSMETFRRVMRDPNSPWRRSAHSSTMPIPVPLNPGEGVGDYMRKFEFWLAQRNLTLVELQRVDLNVERGYRCNYAQWRLLKVENGSVSSSNNSKWEEGKSRRRSASIGPPQRGFESDVRRWNSNGENDFPITDYQKQRNRSDVPRQKQYGRPPSATRPPDSFEVQRPPNRYSNHGGQDESESCCTTCGRRWGDLNRRVMQLEGIVARLEMQPDTATHPDLHEETSPQSTASVVIDLTDDVEPAADEINDRGLQRTALHVEAEEKVAEISPPTDLEDGLVETTIQTLCSSKPPATAQVGAGPNVLSSLVAAYNQVNDKVLLNEKAEEDVLASMEFTIGEDQSAVVDLRNQIYELRASIKAEQDKRDAAIASVIAHNYEENDDELWDEINALAATSAEQNPHEECASIALKLATRSAAIARLDDHLQMLTSGDKENTLENVEVKEVRSKMDLEKAAVASLEVERHKIFLRILKSNRQVEKMVKEKLAQV